MAALRLSNSDRIRRDKLAGLLGSQFDGERLNALSMLQKMADGYKIPIHELLLDSGGSCRRQFKFRSTASRARGTRSARS